MRVLIYKNILIALFFMFVSACERCIPQRISSPVLGLELRDKKTGTLLGIDSLVLGVRAANAQQFLWFADTIKQIVYLPLNPKSFNSEFEFFLLSAYRDLKINLSYRVKIINNPPNCSFYEQINQISVQGIGYDSAIVVSPNLTEINSVNIRLFIERR